MSQPPGQPPSVNPPGGRPPADRPAAARLPTARWLVTVRSGPHAGRPYPLDDQVKIGRSSDNDIVVPDMRASRNHVRIECVDDNCFMIDLGSSNGTLVNGRRIEGTVQLADGDVFTIGCTEFMLAAGAAPVEGVDQTAGGKPLPLYPGPGEALTVPMPVGESPAPPLPAPAVQAAPVPPPQPAAYAPPPASPAATPAAVCPQCRGPLTPGSRFCTTCGHPASPTPPVAAPPPAFAPPPAYAPPPAPPPTYAPPPAPPAFAPPPAYAPPPAPPVVAAPAGPPPLPVTQPVQPPASLLDDAIFEKSVASLCPECGHPLDPGARFCITCGRPVA